MRYFISKGFLVLFFLVFTSIVWAQQDARNEDHDKLRALKAKVVDAFNKRDGQAIAACFTRDFAITTIDQTTLTSAADIEKHFNTMFKSPAAIVVDMKVSPDPEILTSFIDADNGYCYGKNHETYTLKNGTVVPMDSRWTATVHRENGAWKIATIHAGVNFLDNPVLVRSEARVKTTAAIGFAAGVVLILLVSALFRRKKKA